MEGKESTVIAYLNKKGCEAPQWVPKDDKGEYLNKKVCFNESLVQNEDWEVRK